MKLVTESEDDNYTSDDDSIISENKDSEEDNNCSKKKKHGGDWRLDISSERADSSNKSICESENYENESGEDESMQNEESTDEEYASVDESGNEHSINESEDRSGSSDECEEEDPKNTSGKNHSYEKKPPEASAEFKKLKAHIPTSDEGGRWYYKKNACPYCDEIRMRLDRHLLRVHKDKRTVKKIACLPKKSPLRLDLFDLLTNIGNERFNKDEIRNPKKILLVKRRKAKNKGKSIPYLKNKQQQKAARRSKHHESERTKDNRNKKERAGKHHESERTKDNKNKKERAGKHHESERTKDNKNKKERAGKKKQKDMPKKKKKRYTPERVICPVCRGYFSGNTFSHHFSRRHGSVQSQHTRTLLAAARRELEDYHPAASLELIRYVIPYLTDDHIGFLCRNDKLVILYGNKYIDQHESDDQTKLVKGHMQLMTRVLCEMRELDGRIDDLESAIKPDYFDVMIEAAKKLCKTNKKVLGVPYNCHAIRLIWNRLFIILDARYSRIGDYETRTKSRDALNCYKTMFADDYAAKIGSKAQKTQNEQRRLNANAPRVDADDVQIYFQCLIKKRDEFLNKLLKNGYEQTTYFKLIQYQMVLCMLFNGRRPGETDRTRLINFTNRQKTDQIDQFFNILNTKEKEQAIKYEKMICQGKKINGMDCAIYLSEKDIKALETIIHYREKADIDPDNPYLFAYPNEINSQRVKHADAYQANLKLVLDCHKNYKKLNKPELIRATKCRIQIATMFGAVGDPEQLKNITSHLAHTEAIHLNNYRKTVPKNDVNVTMFLEKRIGINVDEDSQEGKLLNY